MATSHPTVASLWAIARPIPRDPPVTSAIFPVKDPTMLPSRLPVDTAGAKTWRVYPDVQRTSIPPQGYVLLHGDSRKSRSAGQPSPAGASRQISAAGQRVEVPQEEFHQPAGLRIGQWGWMV